MGMLSENAHLKLETAQQSVTDAENNLKTASKLIVDAAVLEPERQSLQFVKIGASVASAESNLVEATHNFQNAQLERELTIPAQLWVAFWRIVTSGFFFMVAGALLIFAAQNQLVETHSSITFIWVVLGTALILFGTGTLGMAKLDGSLPSGTYSATLAGGAGVMAILIASGFVLEQENIKTAFQGQLGYFKIKVFPNHGHYGDFRDYNVKAKSLGAEIPIIDKGENLEVFVPFKNGIKAGADLKVEFQIRAIKEGVDLDPQVIKLQYKTDGILNYIHHPDFPLWEKKDETKFIVSLIVPNQQNATDVDSVESEEFKEKNPDSNISSPPPTLSITGS